MKIAQVSPLYESVPPRLYGGTERIVSYLTEALVELGHDVTLFASGDSKTAARLVSPCGQALRLNPYTVDCLAPHMVLLDQVHKAAADFDIIHFHVDYLHFSSSRYLAIPHVTTLHGRLDLPELPSLYRHFGDMPLVSISQHQRVPLPAAHWEKTVLHGLPADLYTPSSGRGDYLAFLGRISPEKGVEQAIAIARAAGIRLKMAAKVDRADEKYFASTIKPLIEAAGEHVEFIGEIDDRKKNEFLGNARCLLFPIDWPEPFGLVMIEAMACGTPVIAFQRGSVPEVLEDGVTGFIVKNVEEAVTALGKLDTLSRKVCRNAFDQKFSSLRMARDYVAVYEGLIEARQERVPCLGAANWGNPFPATPPGRKYAKIAAEA